MMLVEMEAMMRFGMWEDILKSPEPAAYHPISRAYRHFARASAYAAMDKIADAERERTLYLVTRGPRPEKAMMVQNPAHKVLDLAAHTLAGEIAYRKGDTSAAVSELTQAVEIEDTLRYMEPPDWFQPSRHSLGAVSSPPAARRGREGLPRRPPALAGERLGPLRPLTVPGDGARGRGRQGPVRQGLGQRRTSRSRRHACA